jgi:hypothetical protein
MIGRKEMYCWLVYNNKERRTPCECNTLIVPPHIHHQLGNLPRVDLSRFLPHDSDLALSFEQSQAPVEHVLCGKRPPKDSGVPGDESAIVSILFGEGTRDVHCAGAKNADTQVLVLDGIGLHADRRASKGV